MPYLRPMHSICVYSGAGLLRAFGGLPRALSPRRQRLRLWRGFPHLRHLFSRRDRHQSIPIDGQSNSSSPKHVWLNVLCLKHPFPKKSTNSWNYKHKCILLTQPSFHSDLLPEDNFTQPTKGCLLSCTIVTQKVHSSHLKPKLYYQQKTSPKCSPLLRPYTKMCYFCFILIFPWPFWLRNPRKCALRTWSLFWIVRTCETQSGLSDNAQNGGHLVMDSQNRENQRVRFWPYPTCFLFVVS